jgi:hypothetical protein
VSSTDLHAAIAGVEPGSVLTGFVLVAEWIDPNGEQVLTRHTSDDATPWQVDGWLSEGMRDWEDDDDGEDA